MVRYLFITNFRVTVPFVVRIVIVYVPFGQVEVSSFRVVLWASEVDMRWPLTL